MPVGAKVTAVARIDGEEVHRSLLTLDSNGKCLVAFTLPTGTSLYIPNVPNFYVSIDIKSGVGTLSCVIEDGGIIFALNYT